MSVTLHFPSHTRDRKNKTDKARTDARIQKRPIPHPPIASPYAGSTTPKTVYISSSTPFMSAVKRVQKLLHQAEKRAMSSIHLGNKNKTDKQKLAQMADGHENLRREAGTEEVFIKATGRAMDKALRVGRWFEQRGTEYVTRVKTGSVLVVDDVVEDEEVKRRVVEEGERIKKEERQQEDTTESSSDQAVSRSAAKKRKRAASAAASAETEELPETRTRWVNAVEIAVTYK